MNNCIFCKIISKQIPSTIVYENEHVIAFNDINPQAPVHVLIVPKTHIENLFNISENNVEIISNIHLAAIEIASKLGLKGKGFRLVNNCGKNAGQTVFHIHYHLLSGENMAVNFA